MIGVHSFSKIRVLLVLFFMSALGFVGYTNYYYPYWEKRPSIKLSDVYGIDNLVPFLVIGSGPACLSAALYGARTNTRTVVIRGNKPGGQLTGTSFIENWPGIVKIRGADIVQQQQDQASHFGAVMVDDTVASVDFAQWPYVITTEEGRVLRAMAVMIGTGATARGLGVPGEHEYWGRGVTTCAICDAPYHKGDDVVVIGGGDTAMEEALELSSYANTVKVLVRGSELRASAAMIDLVKATNNVTFVFNTVLTSINGNGHHVTSIMIKNTKTNIKEEMAIKGVFLGIGHDPNTKLFEKYLKTDKNRYIKVNCRTQQTSLPGIVAAGDVTDPRYRQAGVAAGDGIKAGLDIVWWLADLGYNSQVQKDLEPYFFDPLMDKKIEISQINGQVELDALLADCKKNGELLLLDFYTTACPSCMHMMPVIEWIASKFKGKVQIYKVDASLCFDLTKTYHVPDVPHLLLFRDGEIVGRHHSAMTRVEMYDYLKKFLNDKDYVQVS